MPVLALDPTERHAVDTAVTWRSAMTDALYGEQGFFTHGPATGVPGGAGGHFRTSANASALFATALLRLVVAADEALGRPACLDVVDVGAGGGHLLRRLSMLAPAYLGRRLRLSAIEVAPRPADLPQHIGWYSQAPTAGAVNTAGAINGVVLATEWLDNVPLDVAEVDPAGVLRYVLVDPAEGKEVLGSPVEAKDVEWAQTWWDCREPGTRIELGAPRDEAWAATVARVSRGLAVLVDYGHLWYTRPRFGTLTGFQGGRSTAAVPDGTHDITAHVAMDSVCAAGEGVAGQAAQLTTQRQALAALGLDGARPALSLATDDPAGYVRALSLASQAAELVSPDGLGGHYWIVQPVGIEPDALPAGLRP